jgi:hypothetical protein
MKADIVSQYVKEFKTFKVEVTEEQKTVHIELTLEEAKHLCKIQGSLSQDTVQAKLKYAYPHIYDNLNGKCVDAYKVSAGLFHVLDKIIEQKGAQP